MKYTLTPTNKYLDDLKKHKKYGNKKLLKKINQFIDELEQHPCSSIGQVERLKYYTER